MTIGIPCDAELWEVVAAIQVCQSQGVADVQTDFSTPSTVPSDLLKMAQLCQWGFAPDVSLNTAKAYREIGSAKETYPAVLARVSGLEPKMIKAPQFPNLKLTPTTDAGIIVCPHEAVEAFKLPWTVWRAIVKHLRSYGVPVRFMGRPGERMDYCCFSEGSNLSNLSMLEQLNILASAKLIVGVPNEFVWCATTWGKKILVLHPDDIPVERWMGFDVAPQSLGRLLYTSSQLQVPVILAGLRKLISAM